MSHGVVMLHHVEAPPRSLTSQTNADAEKNRPPTPCVPDMPTCSESDLLLPWFHVPCAGATQTPIMQGHQEKTWGWRSFSVKTQVFLLPRETLTLVWPSHGAGTGAQYSSVSHSLSKE